MLIDLVLTEVSRDLWGVAVDKKFRTTMCAFVLVGGVLAASCSSDDPGTAAEPVAATAAPEVTPAPDPTQAPPVETTASAEPNSTEATDPAVPVTEVEPAADERAWKVMVIGDETSTISFKVPEAVPAVQGALSSLPNVEVLHCDSKGDTNTALDCQEEAVDAGVAAVIVSFGGVGNDQTVLTEAGIPVIGGADADAPTAFSLSSGLGSYAGLGVAAGAAKCTKIATLYLDGADFLANMVKSGAELVGATEVARSAIPQNTPDIAPAVAALTGSDADCIFLSITPTQAVQAVTALSQSGTEAQLIGVGAVFPKEVIEQLGDLAEGLYTSEIALNPEDPDPVIDIIAADMAKFDDSAKVTTVGILSWSSAKLLIDALPFIDGDVTPASLTAAIEGLKDAPAGGAIHPFNPVGTTNPMFSRFMNPWGLLYRVENGIPVRQTEEFFSLTPGLEAASF